MSARDAELYEDECAECYHGVTLHLPSEDGRTDPCSQPGCECDDFVQPENDGES